MTSTPHHVIIAGGGVAGLEALLALHALGGEHVALTLVSPSPDFVYRPLAVAEPFALGSARRTPLEEATRSVGATFVHAPIESVDAAGRTVRLGDGSALAYDALVLATGAGSEPAFGAANVLTWDDSRDVDTVGGLLRDLEEGYSKTLAVVIPPGPGWPPRAIVMRPSGRRLEVTRVLALPRLRGRAPAGIPADADGFVSVDAHGRVTGVPGVWAAGDGIAFPVKFGGLAAEQADAAAADIAADAGALVERKPFRPVLRGRLLTSSGPRYMRYDASGGDGEGEATPHTLWWPPSKVNGRYLAPW